jgi:hypothetical protein
MVRGRGERVKNGTGDAHAREALDSSAFTLTVGRALV